jgi:multiple sugar transport system permease protein
MFAVVLCPDEKMWTLMVWLVQMQYFSARGAVMASLVVSAIPTLIVFIFAQNIILRGIVLPVEK